MTQALVSQRTKLVGKSVKSVGATRALLGKTSYVDDLQRAGMLYLSFARSSLPHADIKGVELGKAKSVAGVSDVLSGAEIRGQILPFPILASPPGLRPVEIYPMATQKVRYVGEIVACVLSTSRSVSEDAAELVETDYSPRMPVLNPEKALDDSSSLVIDEWPSNVAYSTEITAGDVEKAFRDAHHIAKTRFRIQRQYGAPMEPRGVLADYDYASESLTLFTSTQWPHVVRTTLSRMLGMEEHRVRVIAPDVGGGFGNKQDVYPEEVMAAYLSRRTRKPVKWTASRSEDMLSTVHARDQIHYVEVASSLDGTLTGVRDRIVSDLGAFHSMSIGPQLVTIGTLSGAYKIKNWDIQLRCAVTNKTPVGAYRGFGASESNFVIERSIDMIATDLKLDRSKLRLKNFIRPEEFPYETALGSIYDSGDYGKCLTMGLRMAHFEEFKTRQEALRKKGRFIGLGLSFVVESTGIGSSRQMALDGFKVYAGYDSATVRVDRSGAVTVLTGLSPHGQGLETTLAQVCADELGVGLSDVKVLWGDTESSPYGFGTWGSRSAITGSSVVKLSCSKLKEKARKIAAEALKIPEEVVTFEGKMFSSPAHQKSISLREVAERAYSASDLPPGMEPGLEATSFYDPPRPAYSYAAHLPVVEVDLETGYVKILSYDVVHDCGTVINPAIVEGQLHGGIAQGIAGALLEELKYDEDGQFISSSFLDYLIPTSFDVPDVKSEYTETPTDINPLGVKGTGEGGAIAPPAAIAGAVEDALSQLGVKITETPITAEKLASLIRAAISEK